MKTIIGLTLMLIPAIEAFRVRKPQTKSETKIPFTKDTSAFVCIQKWEKTSSSYTNQFCLIDVEEVVSASKEKHNHIYMTNQWEQCQAKGDPSFMKTCKMKGKRDRRISYEHRRHIPKSCFRKIFVEESMATLFQAAITAGTCTTRLNAGVGGNFAETAAPAEEEVEEEVEEGGDADELGTPRAVDAEEGANERLAAVHSDKAEADGTHMDLKTVEALTKHFEKKAEEIRQEVEAAKMK
jgi:hypothetical protein